MSELEINSMSPKLDLITARELEVLFACVM